MTDFNSKLKGNVLDLRNTLYIDMTSVIEFIRQHPEITSLDLSSNRLRDRDIKALAESQVLTNLTSLNLASCSSISSTGVEYLAESQNLKNLAILSLNNNNIGDKGVQALAKSQNLKNLVELYLNGNEIGDKGVQALAKSQTLTNLTGLGLASCGISSIGVEALAESQNLKNLAILSLNNNNIGDPGAQALAKSQNLKNLTSLGLASCGISSIGVEALAESQNLKNLVELYLHNNEIGDPGVQALAESQNLKNLVGLYLHNNEIGDPGVQALAESQNLKNLTSLGLASCGISSIGAQALAESQNLPNLTGLSLKENEIGDSGVQALAASQNLKNLTVLNLENNEIGDQGVQALAESQNLTNLVELYLKNNEIGDQGVQALAKSQGLKDLKVLDLDLLDLQTAGRINLVRFFVSRNCYANQVRVPKCIANTFLQAYRDNSFNITPEIVQTLIFELAVQAERDYVKYFVERPEEYPFLINSRDDQGHSLMHYYTHSPDMKKFLFERGMVPEPVVVDDQLNLVVHDVQSVHRTPIVQCTNFTANKLVQDDHGDRESRQEKAESYKQGLDRLNDKIKSDIKSKLLCLTSDHKKKVMATLLRQQEEAPDDHDYVNQVISRASETLHTVHLDKDSQGRYNPNFGGYGIDIGREVKITIPESMKLVESLIQVDKKELLVTLYHQNPQLVANNLNTIREKLGSEVTAEQLTDKSECSRLLSNVDDQVVTDLFKDIDQVKITIPESMKLVESLIQVDKKELLVTLYHQNPQLVATDLNCIRERLGRPATVEQLTDKSECSRLLSNVDDRNRDQVVTALLNEISRDKITIPESIGLVKSLIDKMPVPTLDKKELLVTLCNQNPQLVAKKLNNIKEQLDGDITLEQLTNKSDCHTLLSNVDDQVVSNLFKNISGLDLEQTWREQQEFKLAEGIFQAATTYEEMETNRERNACIQGTLTQIASSAQVINPQFINEFAEIQEREQIEKQEAEVICNNNIHGFVGNLANNLLQSFSDKESSVQEALVDFSIANVNIQEPERITMAEQAVLAKINSEFVNNIHDYLPNYQGVIPTLQEYEMIINKLPEMPVLEKYATEYGVKKTAQAIGAELSGFMSSSSDIARPSLSRSHVANLPSRESRGGNSI